MDWDREIEEAAQPLLAASTSDYSTRIWEIIGADVVDDVRECSAIFDEGYFSDEDVRLAIGRALCQWLGIEY